MHQFKLSGTSRPLRTALLLGAHCDDIEIGCGATVLRLAREIPEIEFHWIVFSSGGVRGEEARSAAHRFLEASRGQNVEIKDFRNGFFPYVATEIKEYFEEIKTRISPDIVFTHYAKDYHQDHRLLSELTWNTFRNHWILEYEIPKYDGDLERPNLFVTLERELCDRKIEFLMQSYPSQRDKHWFTEDTFRALLRIRGVESCSPTSFAEAFYCRKLAV